MRDFIAALLCISQIEGFCQAECRGVLLDSLTKQPIEFANIGLVGKGLGTVSDENGAYRLSIPDSLQEEPVRISIIGYKAVVFKAKELDKHPVVMLAQNFTPLKEVAVSAKKARIKIQGNDTRTHRFQAGFNKNNLGAELAVKLHIKHPQTHLLKLMFNIAVNNLDTCPLFRINIYREDDKGFPGENMLTQNVIVMPKTRTGMVEVDLTPYAVFTDRDVFIAIEWIKDLGNTRGLYFSTRVPGSATYHRQASQGKWEKANGVGVGLHAEVAY